MTTTQEKKQEINEFIEDAIGDPVIVPHRSTRVKTGVVIFLESTNSQPATNWDEVKWIRVQFDDGGEGIFYHTSVKIDLDWVEKIKDYE